MISYNRTRWRARPRPATCLSPLLCSHLQCRRGGHSNADTECRCRRDGGLIAYDYSGVRLGSAVGSGAAGSKEDASIVGSRLGACAAAMDEPCSARRPRKYRAVPATTIAARIAHPTVSPHISIQDRNREFECGHWFNGADRPNPCLNIKIMKSRLRPGTSQSEPTAD